MNLKAGDLRLVLRVIDDLYSAESREELWRVSWEGLRLSVPGDIHDIVIFDTRAPEQNYYFNSPHGYATGELETMLAHGAEHPVAAYYEKVGDCGAMSVSQVRSLAEWRGSHYYSLGNGRLRQDYEIAALMPGVTFTGVAGVSLSRSGKDFTERDRMMVDHLRGHLGRVWGRMLRKEVNAAAPSVEAIRRKRPHLTYREAEVLLWLSEGKRDGEIAVILGLSPLTVTTHVRNLLAKLKVESRVAAVAVLFRG